MCQPRVRQCHVLGDLGEPLRADAVDGLEVGDLADRAQPADRLGALAAASEPAAAP